MRRLHPATIIVVLLPKLREAIQTAIPLLIGSFASNHSISQEWIGIAIGGLTGLFAITAYWTTRFDIQSDHVVHTTGWIFRKDRRIPLEQIQNVSLRQNVLERLFKVATVDVETAMGRGRDLKLSVLSLPEAERFREELLGAAHLNPTQAANAEKPLVTLTMHDLLLGAVTENHLGQMIVLLVTFSGPVIGAVVKYASKVPAPLEAVAYVGGAAVLFIGSWLWGVATYFLKYGGFSVRRDETAFRISYGLLNKVQMVIRPSRIEYLHVTASLPQRWMERASFQVGTASSFGESGVFAPVALFVERQRAYQSAASVIPGLDIANLRWRPLHPIFYRAAAVRALFFLALFTTLAKTLSTESSGVGSVFVWLIYGLIATLIFFQLTGLFLSKPENGFAITDDALVVRRGYLHQSISAMPIGRMENVAITQPFWWKRYGAARLAVQAMKHRIHVGGITEEAIAELMDTWHKKIESKENQKLYTPHTEEIKAGPIVADLHESEEALLEAHAGRSQDPSQSLE